MKTQKVSILLDNLRSAHNVGSIFRTADAAGASHMYLTGTTPRPVDRFGRLQPDIVKTALGAEKTVSWEYHEDATTLAKELQQKGNTIVVVEQTKNAQNYAAFSLEGDTVFIFGNEVDGVAPELFDVAEKCIHIPMRGEKESLNVAVAVGVILFHVC